MAERLRPAAVLLVGLGGMVGTAVRVASTPPHRPEAFPVATFVINLLGAALLGLLVARLARPPATPRRHRLGLLLGTGALGGFTTYSALAVDCVQLVRHGAPGLATAYAVGTLLLGAMATGLGLAVGRARPGRP